MSKSLRLSIAAAAAAAGVATGAASASTPPPGSDAPDFVLKSLAGSNIRLSEYRGEVVMLSFWASWCGDCRPQLEALDDMRALYADAGLVVLAVSLDTDGRTAAKALQGMDIAYPVLHDAGGDVGRLYDIGSMPTTILIDRDGVVRGVYEGRRREGEQPYVESAQELLREF